MKPYAIVAAVILALTVSLGVTAQISFAQSIKTSYICISIYNDSNGNGRVNASEGLVSGAFVQIFNSTGNKIAWHTTDANYDPICTQVAAGRYRVTVKVPDGYKPTTRSDWEFDVPEDATGNLEFGVQYIESRSADLPPTQTKRSVSRLFDFASGLVLGAFTFLTVACPCTFGGVFVGGTMVWVINQLRRPSNLPPAQRPSPSVVTP